MIYFLLLIFSTSLNLYAQILYPKDTTYYTIDPPEEIIMPDYLSFIDDTTTLTRIKRITEKTTWGYLTYSYSKIQPWNADASMYKFRSVYIYNADTHEIIKKLDESHIYIYESFWSNVDPNLLYSFREDGKIKLYNVKTDSLKTLFNFNENEEVYEIVKLGPGEGNIDIYDKYVALVGKIKNTTDLEIIVFDLQKDKIIKKKRFAGAWGETSNMSFYSNWVSVSQSGKYVGINWDHNNSPKANPYIDQDGIKHYGIEIYNTTDLKFLRRVADYGNHGDFGFTPNGEEVYVQFWGDFGGGSIFSYHLDDENKVDIIHIHDDFEYHGGHLSCRNILRPGWAYVSTRQSAGGRLFAIKLDGSQVIENFGHSFSSGSVYIKEAQPCPAPLGNKLMFKSDFGNDSNSKEVYVFEAYPIPTTTSINKDFEIPMDFKLFQNYPNPFNPLTTINYSLPVVDANSVSTTINVTLKIYNILGEEIATLVNKKQKPGNYRIEFNASELISGIYFYRFTAGDYVETKKMILIK